jgi:hypothetical protein
LEIRAVVARRFDLESGEVVGEKLRRVVQTFRGSVAPAHRIRGDDVQVFAQTRRRDRVGGFERGGRQRGGSRSGRARRSGLLRARGDGEVEQ